MKFLIKNITIKSFFLIYVYIYRMVNMKYEKYCNIIEILLAWAL